MPGTRTWGLLLLAFAIAASHRALVAEAKACKAGEKWCGKLSRCIEEDSDECGCSKGYALMLADGTPGWVQCVRKRSIRYGDTCDDQMGVVDGEVDRVGDGSIFCKTRGAVCKNPATPEWEDADYDHCFCPSGTAHCRPQNKCIKPTEECCPKGTRWNAATLKCLGLPGHKCTTAGQCLSSSCKPNGKCR